MKTQTLKLNIFLLLFGCSVSIFAQQDNSVPNDKSAKKSIQVERLEEICPIGEVFVPNGVYIGKIPLYFKSVQCPLIVRNPAVQNNVLIVKAEQGDTVETVAKRYGADPIEVTKFNGLFVVTKLPSGREIKIPRK